MLTKSTTIKADTRSMHNVVKHLLDKPDENESISLLHGSRQDVKDAFSLSKISGHKNALKHFMFSSETALQPSQMSDMIRMVRDEFGLPKDAVKLVVMHQKERHEPGVWDRHFHMLVGTTNPENGKAFRFDHSYARQEKVSRLFELKHGLALTKGRHNRAVIAAVDDPDAKARLEHLGQGKPPSAAFSSATKERCKRQGIDVAEAKSALRDAWSRCDNWQSFTATIAEHGMIVREGDKKPIPVIEMNGVVIGSASRLLGIKKADLERHMSVSGEQKAAEAGQDHDKAQTPDDWNTYRSAPDSGSGDVQQPVRKPANVRKPGRSVLDGLRPERVKSAERADLKGKSKEMQNVELIAEEITDTQTKIINEQLSNQKKNQDEYAKTVESLEQKMGDKTMNRITLSDEFKASCKTEIKYFESVLKTPPPDEEIREFERMNSKERFEFAHKKVLKAVRDRKQHVKELEAEIKSLKSNAHWWNRNGQKIKTNEAEVERLREQIAQIAIWLAKKIMSKFKLCDDPGDFKFMSSEDWNEHVVDEKTKELANVIQEIAECRETGYKKMAKTGVEYMEKATLAWKERPEAQEAKLVITRMKSLLDNDSFNERTAEFSDEDIEKLKADIEKHDPISAAQTLINGGINAGDKRTKEREQKEAIEAKKAAELAEIKKREQAEIKKEQAKNAKNDNGKKGSEIKIA